MSLAELNRMLKRILLLVLNYDKPSPRMETEGTAGSKSTRVPLAGSETRSEQSRRSFYSAGNKMEIPDPWDDPLM